MSKLVRLKHLSAYLQVLTADVAERGGFVAFGQDPVEAAARALLSGTKSMIMGLWDDVKTLAKLGATATKTAMHPVIKEATAEAVGNLFEKAFNKVFGK